MILRKRCSVSVSLRRTPDLARVHTDERIAVADLGPAVGFYTWLIRNSAQ